MNNRYVSQLDAIPTVGFRDPILSYFSALRFSFDDVRMLREGYKKVIPLFILMSTLPDQLMTFLPIEKTRSIQNRQFSEMDGAGCRIRPN